MVGKEGKKVYGTESNEEYFKAVAEKVELVRLCHDTLLSTYSGSIYQWVKQYDIIIIDGEPIQWRDACVQPALDCLKPGGKLIIDNWLQPSVGWMPTEETQQLLSQYPVQIYPQQGHPDWKTILVTKP